MAIPSPRMCLGVNLIVVAYVHLYSGIVGSRTAYTATVMQSVTA